MTMREFYRRMQGKLDTSNFDKSHEFYSEALKFKVGVLRSETGSTEILEYAATKSKEYAYILPENRSTLKGKGIPKHLMLNQVKFEHYKAAVMECLSLQVAYSSLRSSNHRVVTCNERRKVLTPLDNKLYILPNQTTCALGFFRSVYFPELLDEENQPQ